MEEQLIKKAKKIIEKILYITIATSSRNSIPWNNPVYSAYDGNYTFYWASDCESRHSKNIMANNRIAIIIYDSSVPAGKGVGVYFEAKAYEIDDQTERKKAYELLAKRASGYPWSLKELNGTNRPHLYKAIPKKVWMNVDGEIDGHFIDKRVEIKLL